MKTSSAFLGAASLGATVLYLFNTGLRPASRRRVTEPIEPEYSEQARPTGLLNDARSQLIQRHVQDYNLECTICSRIEPLLRDAGAVRVSVDSGVVTLQGHIREREKSPVLKAVGQVPGVRSINNQTESEQPLAVRTGTFRPALLGLGGVSLVWGLLYRGRMGSAASLAGAAAIAASILSAPRQLSSIEPIRVQKILHINAPVERVFEFWSNFENFPRFMPHLREVRIFDNGLTRWVASGPVGLTFSWIAQVTKYEHNNKIAWRSVKDSQFDNEGCVGFSPEKDRGTRVEIGISFVPPAGAFGHALANLLGFDLRTIMDQNLLRLKSLIEHGKTRSLGHKISYGQNEPSKIAKLATEAAAARKENADNAIPEAPRP